MEIEGRSAEELCQEAFEFLQQGRLAAAVERLEKVLAARPDYFDAHLYLGIAYGYMGRMEEAEEHLRRAVELLPDNAPARYNLGLVLHYRGRHEEAMREFRTSLELNPYYEPVRKILAELGEPVEQMVERILEAREAEEEGRKTFAEKFAEAPWAALKEKEAELVALPPAEEKPAEKPLSNFWARAVTTVIDWLILSVIALGLVFGLGTFLGPKGVGVFLGFPAGLGGPPLPGAGKGKSPLPSARAGPSQPRKGLGEALKKLFWEGEIVKGAARQAEALPLSRRLLGLVIPVGLPFLYFALAWALFGKTVGMRVMGLELANPSFERAAPWQGVLRWIVFVLPGLADFGLRAAKPSMVLSNPLIWRALLLLGLLMLVANIALISATERKQAIHDLAAGTLVVGRSLPAWLGLLVLVLFLLVFVVAPLVLLFVLGLEVPPFLKGVMGRPSPPPQP